MKFCLLDLGRFSAAILLIGVLVPSTRADPPRLDGDQVRQALAGKSLTYGGRNDTDTTVAFGADGGVTLRTMTQTSAIRKRAGDEPTYRISTGRWFVEQDGRYCLSFTAGEAASSSCYHLLRTEKGYVVEEGESKKYIKVDKLE